MAGNANQPNTKLAYLYVSLVVLLWASTVPVAKLLLQGITNIQLLFFTRLFAVIGLFVIVTAQGKLKILRKYSKRDYFHMAYMGALGSYFYDVCLFGALRYAPAQEVSIINYLWPMMVVMIAVLILKEKITVKKIIGLILSFAGICVVATKGDLLAFSFTNAKGDILAVLGAVSYGVFSVLGKKHSYEKYTCIFLCFCFGFALSAITMLMVPSIPKVSLYSLQDLAGLG